MSFSTMKKIQSVTVGSGGANTITFSNIPQTYTDLVIYVSARSSRAVNDVESFQIKPNNTMTSDILLRLQGQGATASSFSANSNETYTSWLGNSGTASTFNNTMMYFPNYAGSTKKSYFVDGVVESNSTTVNRLEMNAMLTNSTSAITSIVLSGASYNFVEHSTATLYGIKNS